MAGKALITGGAVRVGRDLALALAGAGFDVVIHYRRNEAAAAETARLVRAAGRQAWTIAADLALPHAAASLLPEAVRLAGAINILINNAAIFSRGTLQQATAADFTAAWQVNTLAPILLTQSLASHIHDCGPAATGCVINLLDCRLDGDCGDSLAYALSKRALAGFTRDAARALAPQIRVNAIAPGPVLPPPASAPREKGGVVPLGVRPTPGDIAAAALFLINATTTTGQTIYIDGGQHLVR